MSLRPALLALLASVFAAPAYAVMPVWDPAGVLVCGSMCGGRLPLVLPDGDGGLYVAWQEGRDFATNGEDIYLQRLTAAGEPAPGWPAEGRPVCIAPQDQYGLAIAPDGFGGVLLVWSDLRNVPAGGLLDIFAHRILPSGEPAPGWVVNGMPVCRDPGYQYLPAVCPDGSGGAFFAWHDFRDGLIVNGEWVTTIYMQHLSAAGTPAEGWHPDGEQLTAASSGGPRLAPDDAGGVVVIWADSRRREFEVDGVDVRASRLTAGGGVVPGWPAEGLMVLPYHTGPRLAAAGSQEFYVAGQRYDASLSAFVGYRVQKLHLDGQIVEGWPGEGISVYYDRTRFLQALGAAPDGLGGVVLAWYDNGPDAVDIRATRVLPSGAVAEGWGPNGIRVSDPAVQNEGQPDICSDGAGGAYVTWERATVRDEVYVQHVATDGSVYPGWPLHGLAVSPGSLGNHPRVASEGDGNMFVAWEGHGGRLYAQRFLEDDIVPTRPSLVSAEAEADRVVLSWYAREVSQAVVERRTSYSEWLELGPAKVEPASILSYEDRMVTPGERYAYRLAYWDGGVRAFTEETWVDVPSNLQFAVHGFSPNPSVGMPTLSLTLPTSDPARLEVYDLRGRLVLGRDLSSLGPGRHLLPLNTGARLASGVYLLRLTQGDSVAQTRGVVLD